mgnify:CR=1 FL=1
MTDSETKEASSSEKGGLCAFRVGRMIQPKFMVGAKLAWWMRSEEDDSVEIT